MLYCTKKTTAVNAEGAVIFDKKYVAYKYAYVFD